MSDSPAGAEFSGVESNVTTVAGGFVLTGRSPVGAFAVELEHGTVLQGTTSMLGPGELPGVVPGRKEVWISDERVTRLVTLADGTVRELVRGAHVVSVFAEGERGWWVAAGGSTLELRFVPRGAPTPPTARATSAAPTARTTPSEARAGLFDVAPIVLDGRSDTRALAMGRGDRTLWIVALFGRRELGVFLADAGQISNAITHHLDFDAESISFRVDGSRAALALRSADGRGHFGTLDASGRFRERLHPVFPQADGLEALAVAWIEDGYDVVAVSDEGEVLRSSQPGASTFDRVRRPCSFAYSRRTLYTFGAEVDATGQLRLRRNAQGLDGFVVRQTLDVSSPARFAHFLQARMRVVFEGIRRETRGGYRASTRGDEPSSPPVGGSFPLSVGGRVRAAGVVLALESALDGVGALRVILAGETWADDFGALSPLLHKELGVGPSLLDMALAFLRRRSRAARVESWAAALEPVCAEAGAEILLARGAGPASRLVLRWSAEPTRASVRALLDAFAGHVAVTQAEAPDTLPDAPPGAPQ